MKFSALTFGFTLLSSTSALCNFNVKLDTFDSSINGLFIHSFAGVATLGPPFTPIVASFPDANDFTLSTLNSIGLPGDGNGKFMLEPSLGVERVIFADVAPPGARFTDWSLTLKSPTSSIMTYGTAPGGFVIYAPPSAVAHYEVYWVPQGVVFKGSPVNLVAQCIN